MSGNDPLRPNEGTIIKPSPRGRANAAMQPTNAPEAYPDLGKIEGSGANPLLSSATSLLALAAQLRRSPTYDDVSGLFRHLCQEIRSFDQAVSVYGIAAETTSVARYVVCSFLDEAILNTPWGSEGNWGSSSLLAEFHNDVYGGEKVFQLIDRLKLDPEQHLDLLELIYVGISLGFQGQYRARPDGLNQLEMIRTELYSLINRIRGPANTELSPNWQGFVDGRPGLVRYVPWWVITTVAAAILVGSYFVFVSLLGSMSDPVAKDIALLGRDLPALSVPPAPPPRNSRTLALLMENDIASNQQIEARDDPNTVIFRKLFPTGSASVAADNKAIMERVAIALGTLEGKVIVTGHTDDIPIRTLRFPSNWELSQQRAEAVRLLLQDAGVSAARLTAEARADSTPYCATCPQSDREQQANNRRVEIRLAPGANRE
jgi:type VI secretion system protein ImpK